MLNRKYNKNRSEKTNNNNNNNNNTTSTTTPTSTSSRTVDGSASAGPLRKKNLHVSTSLPGPLAGYKRKRTQAVQAGDDSEFYKSGLANILGSGPPRPYQTGSSSGAGGFITDEDEDETADYEEVLPNSQLRDVTTISAQTTPVKMHPPKQQQQKQDNSLSPQKQQIMVNSTSGCGSEFCIKKAKCLCDTSVTSPADNTSSSTPIKTATINEITTPNSKTYSLNPNSQPLAHTKSSDPPSYYGKSPSKETVKKSKSNASKLEALDDDDDGGGFVEAVKDVFTGHFNQMQRRGDLENVVVKFAGNLVSQVGLEHKKVAIPQQIVVEREQWDSKVDFLLSVVGFAVDLSAVWRFPAVCFANGGGAFLLPYIIMILICGLPLMYMEFCLGQFQRNGCITVWNKICPMFKGLGFAICVITSIIAMYYNTIMAWSLYILLSSISTAVPWDSCNNPWNSNDSCVTFEERARLTKHVLEIIKNCTLTLNASSTFAAHETSTTPRLSPAVESFLFLRTDLSANALGGLLPSGNTGSGFAAAPSNALLDAAETTTGFDREAICNMTANSGTTKFVFQNQISSAEEYFYNGVLEFHRSSGFTDLGTIKWQIALCLLSIFVIVYFALWKGVKSSGKAVWFTATFPYAVLFILLCRVMMLPGSWTGVVYYITPNFEALKTTRVWQEAAGQVLFQLGPGFGVLLALSSYNKFHNNCLTDAVVTTAISSFTSIMAGFVVFGTLGYIAGILDKPIDQLEPFGYGLTFVAYPEAISTLPGAPIWAVLFFAMLINLGLDTTFGGLESMITGLLDYLPLKLYKRREYFVLALIVYIYLGALPTCTYGGILLVQFYDSYGVEIPLLLIAFLECVGVCYIYGIPHFSRDIAQMNGKEPHIFWKFCWCFISPFVVLFSFVSACFREKDTSYRGIEYPGWASVMGWGLTLFSISCVPVYMLYLFLATKGSFSQRLVAMVGENAWALVAYRDWKHGQRTKYHLAVGDNEGLESETARKLIDHQLELKNNTPSTSSRQVHADGGNKKATIVDMKYCDIEPPSTANSPLAPTKAIV